MTDETIESSETEEHDVFSEPEEESQQETSEEEQNTEENSEETGEKETSEESPSEDKKDENEDGQSDKTVPIHQFKAALKDVTDKLDAANEQIAQLSAKPAPDRETDPQGYELYNKIELSKQIMRDAYPDYNDKIRHYNEMVKQNPQLNVTVVSSANPAKTAYDLAKQDLEIKELSELRDSDEWKEFQNWKAGKSEESNKPEQKEEEEAQKQQNVNQKASEVPNLNRATDVGSKQSANIDDDDELFAGAL